MTTTKIWECKIGEVDSVAGGADYPMRQAVAAAYREITGAEPVFIFSGWGALLTEAERAVVENRLPVPAHALENWIHRDSAPATAPEQPAWHDAPTCAGLWLCDEGRENPYCFTTHRVTWPLNSMLLGEGERWFGPIPEDKP